MDFVLIIKILKLYQIYQLLSQTTQIGSEIPPVQITPVYNRHCFPCLFMKFLISYFQCFGYPNYFRIVLTPPEEMIKKACDRIGQFCREILGTDAENGMDSYKWNSCVQMQWQISV